CLSPGRAHGRLEHGLLLDPGPVSRDQLPHLALERHPAIKGSERGHTKLDTRDGRWDDLLDLGGRHPARGDPLAGGDGPLARDERLHGHAVTHAKLKAVSVLEIADALVDVVVFAGS